MPTKIVHWSAMLLLSFGVTVTYLVYQLKPATDGFMSTQEPLLKNTSTFVATPHTERPQQTIHERLTQSEQAKPADDANTVDNADAMATAFVLNQLLADYFTTDFDLPTQTKWQQQLDAGTPFLAELANYLKLNNLFDIDLHFDENRLYTSQLILKLNPETGESYESNRIYNLFTFMDTYGKNLWPMKLINAAKSNSYTPKILLNNYDRDFVLKIERQNLAQQLSPLALGIERLLRFHLLTSISNSSGLQTYFRTKNIDTVETEFTKAEPNTKDTFHLYNLLIQQRWQEAVLFMQSASHLNSSDNLFFYDILAINAPEALLSNVNYDQYSRQAAWWDRFFQYELCISSRAHYQTIINERLSITLPCTTAQPTNIPALYLDANVDLVMESFWQHILNNPTLTKQAAEQYLANSAPAWQPTLFAMNTHTVVDFLARNDRLKIFRNAYLIQRIEANFTIWQLLIGKSTEDSFYRYSAIHHWYSDSRDMQIQVVNQQMLDLLPTVSEPIKQQISKTLINLIETSVIKQSNWANYQPLVTYLAENEKFILMRFQDEAHWASASTAEDFNQLNDYTKNRLNNFAFEVLFTSQAYNEIDQALDFDQFIANMANRMRVFSNLYPNTSIAVEINQSFNDQGEINNHTMRSLTRAWKNARPND